MHIGFYLIDAKPEPEPYYPVECELNAEFDELFSKKKYNDFAEIKRLLKQYQEVIWVSL